MGTECHLQFTNLSLKAPVYMYYKLNNFYQNHRRWVGFSLTHIDTRYVRSRSDDQLNGVVITATNKVPDCAPYASLNDSSDINLLYQPCGLIAHSTFNDSFILSSNNGTIIPLQKQGIAWPSDLDKFHNQPAGVAGIRVIPDVTDEDFIVWMRTAALPTFKKLYRVINEDMTGDYTVAVRNRKLPPSLLYSPLDFPVAAYSGQKAVVFAETNALGGKNPFLGYAYIVVGGLCFLLGIIFLIQHLIGGRKLGDIDYLKWHTE